MINKANKNAVRAKRHLRVRNKVSGTVAVPRLNVYRSTTHSYAQIIDDVKGNTLVSSSTIAKGMDGMLSRNLLYTAISRAKKRVILYGDPQALDVAVQKNLPQRKSLLVPKTRMLLECA